MRLSRADKLIEQSSPVIMAAEDFGQDLLYMLNQLHAKLVLTTTDTLLSIAQIWLRQSLKQNKTFIHLACS